MRIDDLMAELGRAVRIPGLALDPRSQTCRLTFDGALTVDLESLQDGQALVVHAAVLRPGPEGAEAVLRRALEANLFGRDTGAASLGYDPAQEELVLFRRWQPGRFDFAEFAAGLEAFLATLTRLRESLPGAAAGGGPVPAVHAAIRG